jgi:hypothetical protein
MTNEERMCEGAEEKFLNAKRRERGWFSPFLHSLDEGVSSIIVAPVY